MTIYIDNDYKCHVYPAEDRREFDVPFFNGKCDAFIEGYRYVPAGETWITPDGYIFQGEMISPWKNYDELWKAQAEHDLKQYNSALTEIEIVLGVAT